MSSILDIYDQAYERRDRDTYFFDLVREAGLDPEHPHDWVTISNFAKELLLCGDLDA